MLKLYHKDVFLPDRVASLVPQGVMLPLEYSQHTLDQFWLKYKRGQGTLPPLVVVHASEIIEVETNSNSLNKFVARFVYTDMDDLILVIIPKRGGWFVKTAWLNRRTDKHKTLKRFLYVQPAA